MADKDRTVLFSVRFDQNKLDKELKSFAKKFSSTLNQAFKSFSVDLKGLKTIPIKVELNLADAEKKLEAFQRKAAKLPVAVVPAKEAPAAPKPPKATPNLANITLNADQVANTAKKIDGLKNSLRLLGLSEKDVQSETGRLETKLRSVSNAIDHLDQKARAFKQTTGQNYLYSDKDILRLGMADQQLADINRTLDRYDTSAARAHARTRDGSRFFQSFAFQVGILGFGLQTVGQRLIQVSQALFQLTANAAKAVEPLQRIQNLLSQDQNITAEQRNTIVDEINRLADIPGSNLEATADGFRKLNSIGLEMVDTLALLEGLIKATGRSGVGPEGVARLAQQFRQFASSGEFRQQDIRAIAESGGKDITNIIQQAFGSLDPEAIERAGPAAFFRVLIEGLKQVPEPLATLTDKLNILRNSLIRMAAEVTSIIMPGFDNLADVLKNRIEPAIKTLVEQFNQLSPEAKSFISTLAVSLPIIATVLGTILVGLGTLAIGISAVTQLKKAWVAVTERLAIRTGVAATELNLLSSAAKSIKSAFAPVAQVFRNFITDLKLVGALIKNPAILNLTRGGTTPIIGVAPELTGFTKVLAVLKGGGLATLTALLTSLQGVAGILPRILGLTSPLGIFLNILLGYLSNAGGSRDNINFAVTELWQNLKQLGVTLSNFAEGRLGRAIIGTLTTIIDLISGSLANALGLLILQLAKAVDLLNSFFGLLSTPTSGEAWASFGENLLEVMVGWMPRLAGLLSSAFIEAFSYAVDAMIPFIGEMGNTPGGNALRKQAGILRGNVFRQGLRDFASNPFAPPPIDLRSIKGDDGIANATDEVDKLNTKLTETNQLTKEIGESFNDLAFKLAQSNRNIQLAQAKFDLERQQRAAAAQTALDINADPSSVLRTLGTRYNQSVARTNKIAVDETSEAIKTLGQELRRTQVNLENFVTNIQNLPGKTPEDQERLNVSVVNLIKAGKALADFAEAGKTNRKEFEALAKAYNEAGQNLTGISVQGDKGKEELRELNRVIKDAADPIRQLDNELTKLVQTQQDNINKAQEQRDADKKAAEEKIKANEALKSTEALRIRLTNIQADIESLEREKSLAKSLQDRQRIQGQILDLQSQARDIQEDINRAGRSEVDIVKDTGDQIERNVANEEQRKKSLQESLNLQLEYNAALIESFKAGFQALDQFKSKMDEIEARRAELGLGPRTAPLSIGRNITAELETEISDLLAENQALGADRLRGGAKVEGLIGNIVRGLADGVSLSRELHNVLQSIAAGAGAEVTRLTRSIVENERAIEASRGRLTGLQPGTTARKDEEAVLQGLLNKQTSLTQEVNVYLNRVRAVNSMLGANAKLVTEELRERRNLNAQLKAELEIRSEELELQSELMQLKLANRQRAAAGAGGLGILLDLRGTESLEAAQLRKEIQLIETKHQLKLKELEFRRIEAEERLKNHEINQEEYNLEIQIINAKIRLLEMIRDEEINSVNIEQANTSLERLVNVLTSLRSIVTDNVLQNFADALKRAGDDIKNNFDLLAATAQTFKDVFVASFVGAFEAIGQAWVDFLVSGESFARGFKKFLGDMLIQLGTALIQMSLAAVAVAFIQGLFAGGLFTALAWAAAAAPMAAVGIAIGTGLVIAGTLLGGGGAKATKTSTTNASNGANAQTGATGQGFDPNRDPKTIFQKALMAQILIDIRHDDGIIVKKVIKAVNNNGRLASMIGNRKLGFGY